MSAEVKVKLRPASGKLVNQTAEQGTPIADLLVLPFNTDKQELGQWQILYAAMQGYLGPIGGSVAEHLEDPGVHEIYFPLVGLVLARKGRGDFTPLQGRYQHGDIFNRSYTLRHDELNGFSLQMDPLETDQENGIDTSPIDPFVIGDQELHETCGPEGAELTWFAAFKVLLIQNSSSHS